METLPHIIVIVGPTASGKTDLGIALAKKYNGEIVSADSRQIYTKMSIGTGKPVGAWQNVGGEDVFMVDGVPHYLMDLYDPGQEVSLAEFKQQAETHIHAILNRGKVPIVVGGTGLYVWSIVDNLEMPHVAPNKKLRRSLEKKSLEHLLKLLAKIDPKSLKRIDTHNPRRVIRALEVAILTGKSFLEQRQQKPPLYESLQIGVAWSLPELYERINRRIDSQMQAGLVAETEALMLQKYGWNLPSMSSIGYKQIGLYVHGEISLSQAIDQVKHDTRNYARRQMTWFRRDKRIVWVDKGDIAQVEQLVKNFLKK